MGWGAVHTIRDCLAKLLRWGKGSWGLLWVAFACMAVVAAANGALAYLLGPALQRLLRGESATAPWGVPLGAGSAVSLSGAVLALATVKGLAYVGQFYFAGEYAQRLARNLRWALFDKGLRSAERSGLATPDRGVLLGLYGGEVAAVESAAHFALASWLRDPLQMVALLGVLLWIDPSWALLLLAAVAVLAWPAAWLSRKTGKLLEQAHQSSLRVGQRLVGVLRLLPVLRLHGAQASVQAWVGSGAAESERALRKAEWARALVPALMEVLGVALLALLLSRGLGSGSAQIISFLAASMLLIQPAKELGRVQHHAHKASAAFAALEGPGDLRTPVFFPEVLPEALLSGGSPQEAPVSRRLRQASLALGGKAILSNIDLAVDGPQSIVLLGPSGAGKTSLMRMLAGLQSPDSGTYEVGGGTEANRQVAWISQEPLLFSGSLAENLLLVNPGAKPAAVEEALRRVGAWDWVMELPQGLNTPVGEHGAMLSGGQKQRLALAQALLSTAGWWMLDESVSALDAVSAKELVQSLNADHRRVRLWATHDLGLIQAADRCWLLDQGRLVYDGPPERAPLEQVFPQSGANLRRDRL